MPNLPALSVADHCPDEACSVPVGQPHRPDCGVAICVSTGHQRRLHHEGPRRPIVDLGHGLVDVHVCGEDVWVGFPHGALEAAGAGLFAYRDAGTGVWTPCDAKTPGAVPDLTRVAQTGTWNPITQLWELPAAAVPDHG